MVGLSRELLTHLAAAGLTIKPHATYQNEWLFSTGEYGSTVGPYDSADKALVAGVAWLIGVASDVRTDRDAFLLEIRRLQAMLGSSQSNGLAQPEA